MTADIRFFDSNAAARAPMARRIRGGAQRTKRLARLPTAIYRRWN